jgi:hypothetical protein
MDPKVLHPPPVHDRPLLAIVHAESFGDHDPVLATTSKRMLSSNVPPNRGPRFFHFCCC